MAPAKHSGLHAQTRTKRTAGTVAEAFDVYREERAKGKQRTWRFSAKPESGVVEARNTTASLRHRETGAVGDREAG